MKHRFLLLFVSLTLTVTAQQQQFANIGDLKLESGEVVRNCRVGYRTFGTLNSAKSNAVLFPTWFSGNTENLAELIGRDKLVNPEGLFVVAVDALGNGLSSAPSSSGDQPRLKFPKFTIGDMVESQHRLLTEKLGISHLHGVMGISMGGMQTFQWVVQYPEFMDVAIPIVGSPQMTAMDVLLWTAELRAIEEDAAWKNGNYTTQPPLRALNLMHTYALTTPLNRVQTTKNVVEFIKTAEESRKFDANDWYRQLEAMLAHDVAKPYGSLDAAAGRVKAKMLIIVALQDHMVNPATALAFAHAVGAHTIALDTGCGHLAPGCEQAELAPAIAQFLR